MSKLWAIIALASFLVSAYASTEKGATKKFRFAMGVTAIVSLGTLIAIVYFDINR